MSRQTAGLLGGVKVFTLQVLKKKKLQLSERVFRHLGISLKKFFHLKEPEKKSETVTAGLIDEGTLGHSLPGI